MKRKYLLLLILIIIPLKFAELSAGALNLGTHNNPIFPENPLVDLSDVKNIPDLYFECQIAQLNQKSIIPLFYNSLVREYIEIYLLGRITQIPRLSILSFQYFPLVEYQLKVRGLPEGLKYIPVIESGLDTLAQSPTGAKGLWQFIPETGEYYGLIINEGLDERSDPEKSTIAACAYLKYLYSIFGDWQLSLLAYHSGPSTVKNAIRQAGGKTSLEAINRFLPLPTQRYLPAYVAIIYVLNNYKKHI